MKGEKEMLIKKIKYTDFDGNEREESFYFNLSKAELARMELTVEGSFTGLVKRLIEKRKGPEIVKIFENIIQTSYGEKSPDGKRFIKSEEATKEFTQTEAYSELIMELYSDANKAAEFIAGILPADMQNAAKEIGAEKLAALNS
jgi:predicted CopG family antitoxin